MGSTATVTHTQKLPDGTARDDFRAELRLIASETGDDQGFVTGVPYAVGYRAFAYPDATGTFTWTDVAPNSGDAAVAVTQPANTRYGITVRRREAGDWVEISPEIVILVDDSGGTQDSATHLNPLPSDLAPPVSDDTRVAKGNEDGDRTMTAPLITPDVILPGTPPNPFDVDDTGTVAFRAAVAAELVGTPTDDASQAGARAVADHRANGEPLMIGSLGDSTWEGFSADASGGFTQAEIVRDSLKRVMGEVAGGIGHRHATTLGYLAPRWTTSAGFPLLDSIGLGQNGCFLPMAAAVTMTTEATSFYLIRQMLNIATVSDLEVIDQYDGLIATLSCYDAAAPAFPGRCDEISLHTLSEQPGARTITVRAKTDAVKTRGATFCNSVFFAGGEGDEGDVVLLNGGRFGSTTANHLSTGLSGQHMNVDALAAANCRIILVQLGLNETDADTYKDGLIDIVDTVNAQYDDLGQLPPSWYFKTPWPRHFGSINRTVATNQEFVDATYQAATAAGARVIDVASRVGDTYTDEQDITADNLHFNTTGAGVAGHYEARELIQALAITPEGGGATVDTSGFVDTTTAQSVGGAKTFSANVTIDEGANGKVVAGSIGGHAAVALYETGDTQPRVIVYGSGSSISFGPGGSTATDTAAARTAAGVLGVLSALQPIGLTGATAAYRLVGSKTSGVPTTGTFSTGDLMWDQGHVYVCTAGGTPGTWVDVAKSYADGAISTHAAASDPHGDRAYADGLFAANDAMLFKGVIDCSANPNYPAASAGHLYKVSVAGKIGGGSGPNVEVGDSLICAVDGTSSGTHGSVGANWYIVQVNLDGAVIGPSSSTNLSVAVFSGTNGKLIADGGTLLSDLLTSAAASATYEALANKDTDGTLAANSDTKYASQKATKTYADTKLAKSSNLTDVASAATAFGNIKQAASDSATGVVELATAAETTTGTDTARAVTPDGLAGSEYGVEVVEIMASDMSTSITTGDGKAGYMVPTKLNGWNLIRAHAGLLGAQSSSGLPTVQIRRVRSGSPADMLSTKITIDANESTSHTAATAPVIDTSNDDVATGDLIYVDIDVAGTGAKGLIVALSFQMP